MHIKRLLWSCAAFSFLALPGCTWIHKDIETKGQYWQRASSSSALHLQGPKAQQMLNRDIAQCVAELRELERLGAVKNAIPVDFLGRVADPDDPFYEKLKEWDSPERDEYLYAEHSDYHDFETCMLDKGWERIKHVPYTEAEQAKVNYLKSRIDYKYRSKIEMEKEAKSRREAQERRLND